ncbi:hypothetical protein NE237_019324 [Protea cynaroides]|uniref:Protein EXECUTER 1, chloroplastic n=1 Tax=Protea cynaroides TaxID=273540 RepID=A0A9Q0KBN6_9MAGN|nr:hypothetical protein NE237_019324 [Protea cynaroides]
MASISAPHFPSSTYTDHNPHKFSFRDSKLPVSSSSRQFLSFKKPVALHSPLEASDPAICRCQNRSDSPSPQDDFVHRRWDSVLQEVVRKTIKRLDDYKKSYWNQSKNDSSVDVAEEEDKEVEAWDWDRWTKHFGEVEEQERIVSILKSQLDDAVYREDFEEAAKVKVAIAAAATKDTVGSVISHFKRAIREERYCDAAFFRDHAGAGLMGWWAGISKNSDDPYGRIIRISAEHGKYVARSYSPRQLATSTAGVPLFEVFLTVSDDGEYKQQAVYLNRNRGNAGTLTKFSRSSDSGDIINPLTGSNEGKSNLSSVGSDTEDERERDDDSDVADGLSSFQNILRDMIPGVKVKVLKVTAPGKVDRDLFSKVMKDIIEDEDGEKDVELENMETEEVKAEADQDNDEVKTDTSDGIVDSREEGGEMAVKVVIGGLAQKLSSNIPPKDPLRVPAMLERTSRLSFTFSIKEDDRRIEAGGRVHTSRDNSTGLRGRRSVDHVMSDLAKFIIAREKIPMKVLKDVGELLYLTLSQAQNRQPLSGTTVFNRIDVPPSSDPLTGLYIGAHGLYTSEVIHLRRKFGMWQEDGTQKPPNLEFYGNGSQKPQNLESYEDGTQDPPNLEFYEYVEAFKLTGDPYVPAGQVAFRAKVGKQNQLPHKGIIPEEFGVIARYRGQGRLAEPGFQNPRWVDGELVILDGKYIKGGPVVGFVYWAPEYQFLTLSVEQERFTFSKVLFLFIFAQIDCWTMRSLSGMFIRGLLIHAHWLL